MIGALAQSFVLASAAFGVSTAVVCALISLVRRLNRASSDDPDESDSDGGGGVRDRPRTPPCGGGEPAWWPEFEREFAEYVARRAASLR